MLSAETAVGDFPLEAVQAMARIAREIEKHRKGRSPAFDTAVGRRREETAAAAAAPTSHGGPTRTEDAIAVAVCAAAELIAAPLIVCFTSSGFTARTVASCRPDGPDLRGDAGAGDVPPARAGLGRGAGAGRAPADYDSMLTVARHKLLELGLAEPGERVVVTAGVPFDQPGTTNLLKIEAV